MAYSSLLTLEFPHAKTFAHGEHGLAAIFWSRGVAMPTGGQPVAPGAAIHLLKLNGSIDGSGNGSVRGEDHLHRTLLWPPLPIVKQDG